MVPLTHLFQAHRSARVLGVSVTFEPGAETAGTAIRWADRDRSHPDVVGCKRGWPKQKFGRRCGWCTGEKKHWHGPLNPAMKNIAILEPPLNAKGTVDWDGKGQRTNNIRPRDRNRI